MKSIYTILDGDRFELKNVKVYEELSDETTACTAEVWLNGEHIGFVRNSGQGEGNNLNFKDKACIDKIKPFETHLMSKTFSVTYPFILKEAVMQYDLSLLIGLMVEAAHYEHRNYFKI